MKTLEVKELYAFVATDGDGDEGILSASFGDMHHPLIGADMARIESLRGVATDISKVISKRVELRKFTNMEVMEVING